MEDIVLTRYILRHYHTMCSHTLFMGFLGLCCPSPSVYLQEHQVPCEFCPSLVLNAHMALLPDMKHTLVIGATDQVIAVILERIH